MQAPNGPPYGSNGLNGLYDLTCDGQEDPILQDAIEPGRGIRIDNRTNPPSTSCFDFGTLYNIMIRNQTNCANPYTTLHPMRRFQLPRQTVDTLLLMFRDHGLQFPPPREPDFYILDLSGQQEQDAAQQLNIAMQMMPMFSEAQNDVPIAVEPNVLLDLSDYVEQQGFALEPLENYHGLYNLLQFSDGETISSIESEDI